MNDSRVQTELAAALDKLWERFLPETRQRVTLLESAAVACANGKLTEAQIRAAHAAAHKLAGSLGSFNLTRGTVAARQLEFLYSSPDPPTCELAPELSSLAAELRTLIENRSASCPSITAPSS